MSVIQTFTGRMIDVVNTCFEDISIVDIAHSLSMQCRFNGHTKGFYSVAEHSALVTKVMMGWGIKDRWVLLAGLLHDAAEAYLGDMGKPIKLLPDMRGYVELEHRLAENIFRRFGVAEYPCPNAVKDADWVMLWREAFTLMDHDRFEEWGSTKAKDVRRRHMTHLDVLAEYGKLTNTLTQPEAFSLMLEMFEELHPAAPKFIREGWGKHA